MKAAVLETYGKPLAIREIEIAPPGPRGGDARRQGVGLCLTDIHIAEGKVPTVTLPVVPGHEFAGVVAALGPGATGCAVGDRVTVLANGPTLSAGALTTGTAAAQDGSGQRAIAAPTGACSSSMRGWLRISGAGPRCPSGTKGPRLGDKGVYLGYQRRP